MTQAFSTSQKLLLAIPMKDPLDAKSRLSIALSPHQRARLAVTLFRNVVGCVRLAVDQVRDRAIDIAVVTSSRSIQRLAGQLGIKWIDDGDAGDLSPALEQAALIAHQQGYQAMCVLPGDLADPSVNDIVQLLSHPMEGDNVAICPSKDMGTNALFVPLPSRFPFQYGERSFHHHYRCAEEARLMTVILPLDSLRRDVDTISDWHDLQIRRPDVAFWRDR